MVVALGGAVFELSMIMCMHLTDSGPSERQFQSYADAQDSQSLDCRTRAGPQPLHFLGLKFSARVHEIACVYPSVFCELLVVDLVPVLFLDTEFQGLLGDRRLRCHVVGAL